MRKGSSGKPSTTSSEQSRSYMGTVLASVSRFSQSFSVVQRLAAILPGPIRQVRFNAQCLADHSVVTMSVGHRYNRTGKPGWCRRPNGARMQQNTIPPWPDKGHS